MRSRLGLVLLAAALAGGCSQPSSDPLAERGRQVYLAQCTQCHNADPAQDGAVGPAVKGASRELLEARILRGSYPPGYKPKRPTNVMPPQPAVAPEIPAPMKKSIGTESSVFVREATPERAPRAAASGMAWPPFDTWVAEAMMTCCAGQMTNQTLAHMRLPSMPPMKIDQP